MDNLDFSKDTLRQLKNDHRVLVDVKELDTDREIVISEVTSTKMEKLKNGVQSQGEDCYLDSEKTYENAHNMGVKSLNNKEYETSSNSFYSVKKCNVHGGDLDSLTEKDVAVMKKTEEQGDSLYMTQKYDDALEQYEKLINVQTTVFYKIGNCYLYKKQYDIASDYYNKSIASGNMMGAYSLANIYRQGLLNSASIYTTEQLYLMAAHAGNYSAMDSVALDYERIKDFTEAVFWFNKTVQIHPFSQYKLACYYFDGVGGLEINPLKGMELLKMSAIKNYLPAIYYLGIVYNNGVYGVKKNIKNQRYGISLIKYAADLGYEPAKKIIDEINSAIL